MRLIFAIFFLVISSFSYAETLIHDFEGCRYSAIKEVHIIRDTSVDLQSNSYLGESPFGDVKFRCDLDILYITWTPNMFREDGTLLDKSKVDGIAVYLGKDWALMSPTWKWSKIKNLPTGTMKFAVTIKAGKEFSLPTAVISFKTGTRVLF